MVLRVDFAELSQEDLRAITGYIAQQNPDRARSFGDELYRKAMSLGRHPKMGRVVPELRDPDVREIIHGAYRIIYELMSAPRRVLVLRFWHAGRGTPRILED